MAYSSRQPMRDIGAREECDDFFRVKRGHLAIVESDRWLDAERGIVFANA